MVLVRTGNATQSGVQNATYTYASDAEASDAYAITLDPVVTAYVEGQEFSFKANTANTGASSLNVNGLGAKTLKKNHDVDTATGDIESGSIVTVVYDGTNMQITSIGAVEAGTLSNVIEDTTPQLGGDLDVNGQKIVSVNNGDIEIAPNGNGDFIVNTDDLYVDTSTGNVGIGTTGPGAKLHVVDSALIRSSNESGGAQATFSVSDGDERKVVIKSPMDDEGGYIHTEGTAYDLHLGTRDYTQAVTIDGATGNVGIGTANPGAKLEVSGGMFLEDPSGIEVAWGKTYALRSQWNGFSIDDVDIGVSRLFIKDGGNVGIGTTAPGAKLHVAGSGAKITIENQNNTQWSMGQSVVLDEFTIRDESQNANRLHIDSTGNVGIGTASPGNPLAVNRSADGVIVDFESADTVEGTVTISGNTTSYNAFVGSHYTQLKTEQSELPLGAVVISTGEIISSQSTQEQEVEVPFKGAVTIITKTNAIELVDVEVEDKDNIVSTMATYEYDPETDEEKEGVEEVYGTKTIQQRRLKEGVSFNQNTGEFYLVKEGYRVDTNKLKAYQVSSNSTSVKNKEYFPYIDTTTVDGDKRVYGVWHGKMSENSKGQSFGQDNLPVYLISQVGLYKIRVTDTNGNIENGDWLETSNRFMEAQKQILTSKENSTIGKALIDVDWSKEIEDPKLGYKWKLIPVIF